MHHNVIIALSCVQFLGAPIPHPRVLCSGKSGFSIDFQFLYIIAFLFKYKSYTTLLEAEFPTALYTTYYVQLLIRRALFIMTMVSFWISFLVKDYYEEKPHKHWIFGAIVASLVMAIDFMDFSNSTLESTFYRTGLYLDVIACIPQFQLTLKKMRLKFHVLFYYVGMCIYDILNIAGLTYDYYKSDLHTYVGLNLFVLKLIFTCGFFIRYLVKRCKIDDWGESSTDREDETTRNNNLIEVMHVTTEPPAAYSAEEYSDGLLTHILRGDDVLVNEYGLMSPS